MKFETKEDPYQIQILGPNQYFLYQRIEIPVIDGEGPFIWDVWVSLSETNFKRTTENWEREGRENEQ
ncbi:DUF2199 domain-containing protein [Neobacillus niacini]|uniref:DUF2199 domain-containing protein n=1 Tax=Neobacillus niacini TaxID=86668 RepID=UPI002041FD58|nr:DUF2199 domain-containing protein [Neobacillus niacini]MCM3693604.1 DUF2199 domain-containing protein [Neobacillus niacini]